MKDFSCNHPYVQGVRESGVVAQSPPLLKDLLPKEPVL